MREANGAISKSEVRPPPAVRSLAGEGRRDAEHFGELGDRVAAGRGYSKLSTPVVSGAAGSVHPMTTAPTCPREHAAGNVTISLNNDPRLTNDGTWRAHCDVCTFEWTFHSSPTRDERLGLGQVS